MRKEIEYAKEYMFNVYTEKKPIIQERSFWSYVDYAILMRNNYEKINEKLLESLILQHKENLKKY